MDMDVKKKMPTQKETENGRQDEQELGVSEEVQSKEEEKTSALDEALKDPELKAEYDARIQDAVEAALAENQEVAEKETQGEEEVEEPEDEISADNQRMQDLDAREKSLMTREMKATAIEELTKEQLPAALADCFNYESEEAFKLSKEKVVKSFQESIKEAVNARLRGKKPPRTSGEGAKSGNVRKNTFSEVINSQKSRR